MQPPGSSEVQCSHLDVSDAKLYYEVRGQGPLFLIMAGGNGTAAFFASFASLLSSHFQVVTYDRRGFWRSPIRDATNLDACRLLRANVADAAALIQHLSPSAPSIVFGSSWAANIAMNLLNTHPQLVRKVIVHEPVLGNLFTPKMLQGFSEDIDRIIAAFRQRGVPAANAILTAITSSKRDRELFVGSPVFKQLMLIPPSNQDWYFGVEMVEWRQFTTFEPEVLLDHRSKLMLMRGAEESPDLTAQPICVLSDRLNLPVVDMPGGHLGYITHQQEFIDSLAQLLSHHERARL
ncbi:alpha/beta-hydrolase [Aspergillus japonicus CBS 114.51]|uniref:Alpha/beta-hydrolase n=2 Tax=Aspergillus TaxID=5052 RepID=A0A2V5HPP2_ASPV1|nr:alpha/beta-hydrolase [Aspergillus japonicus CBS 114.51]PYI13887.1 alpha/beta-hydrolase [Aspergillus violaceofuscus CBS 115571]RAH86345.1 alpha/beta-hydrolase [Aspergillus japonicus CBS 114.51]